MYIIYSTYIYIYVCVQYWQKWTETLKSRDITSIGDISTFWVQNLQILLDCINAQCAKLF